MIKVSKTVFSVILSLFVLFSPFFCSVTYAQEANESMTPPDDFGDPVSIITYSDEDGCTITEKTYVVLNKQKRDPSSGSGWFKNEKTKNWKGGDVSTYYAQGYFSWGNGDVNVSSASGGISSVSGITVSNKSTTSGTGRYGYIFNKYAYVTFSCTVSNKIGFSEDLSVTIRVSESGNTI